MPALSAPLIKSESASNQIIIADKAHSLASVGTNVL